MSLVVPLDLLILSPNTQRARTQTHVFESICYLNWPQSFKLKKSKQKKKRLNIIVHQRTSSQKTNQPTYQQASKQPNHRHHENEDTIHFQWCEAHKIYNFVSSCSHSRSICVVHSHETRTKLATIVNKLTINIIHSNHFNT